MKREERHYIASHKTIEERNICRCKLIREREREGERAGEKEECECVILIKQVDRCSISPATAWSLSLSSKLVCILS